MSSGKDGKSPTSANFLSGMLGSLPPFEELFKMAGMELPDYLKGKKAGEKAESKEEPKDTAKKSSPPALKKPDNKGDKK
jgi:flotillin